MRKSVVYEINNKKVIIGDQIGLKETPMQDFLNSNNLVIGEKNSIDEMSLKERLTLIEAVRKIYESEKRLKDTKNSQKKENEPKARTQFINEIVKFGYTRLIEQMTAFLNQPYRSIKVEVSIQQRCWHLINNNMNVQCCPICGNPFKFSKNVMEYNNKRCKCGYNELLPKQQYDDNKEISDSSIAKKAAKLEEIRVSQEKEEEIRVSQEEIRNEFCGFDTIDDLRSYVTDYVKEIKQSCKLKTIFPMKFRTEETNMMVMKATEFLDENYEKKVSYTQRIFHILNGNYEVVRCAECGKPTIFEGFEYRVFCSKECNSKGRIEAAYRGVETKKKKKEESINRTCSSIKSKILSSSIMQESGLFDKEIAEKFKSESIYESAKIQQFLNKNLDKETKEERAEELAEAYSNIAIKTIDHNPVDLDAEEQYKIGDRVFAYFGKTNSIEKCIVVSEILDEDKFNKKGIVETKLKLRIIDSVRMELITSEPSFYSKTKSGLDKIFIDKIDKLKEEKINQYMKLWEREI